jgi:hypothetical protein
MGKKGVAAGVLTFLVGLLLVIDDLHDFVPVPDFLHFLPDFDPYFVFGFQLHHLYIGAIIILIGLAIAIKYDERSDPTSRS